MKKYSGSHSAAFTIVELLIVIVVIAILAAISIVAYNGIQERARTSALKAEMTQLQRTIQTDVIQNDSDSVAINAPLAYQRGTGTWNLAEPFQNTRTFTMYGVFDTSNDTSANWSSLFALTPNSTNNYISLRATGSSSTSVQGFWQTSAQTNQSVGSIGGIRNTIGRHVGWITGNGTSLYASFDNAAGGSATPSNHNGWSFDSVSAYSPAGITAVAVLVFPEFHDSQTRTLILRWLDREHTITYYN